MDNTQERSLKHVLIVDDEPHVAVLLANALKKLGTEYLFEATQSSTRALEMVRQAQVPYDLIITDYKMPDLSGIDLAQAVRSISPDTQIVVMTAYGTEQLRETIGDLGIEGYISKPFSMSQIREIVKHVLARAAHRDTHAAAQAGPDPQVHDRLHTLRVNVGARCVLLLSASGYPLDFDGLTEGLDISNLSALVAANFMAAAEIGRLLGSGSVFKSSYHEGPEYNIYSYDINGKALLAVIFGTNSKPGTVWFYTKQTAADLVSMIQETPKTVEIGQNLAGALDEQFDELFGTASQNEQTGPAPSPAPSPVSRPATPPVENTQPAPAKLLTFEEALASGLLSDTLTG